MDVSFAPSAARRGASRHSTFSRRTRGLRAPTLIALAAQDGIDAPRIAGIVLGVRCPLASSRCLRLLCRQCCFGYRMQRPAFAQQRDDHLAFSLRANLRFDPAGVLQRAERVGLDPRMLPHDRSAARLLQAKAQAHRILSLVEAHMREQYRLFHSARTRPGQFVRPAAPLHSREHARHGVERLGQRFLNLRNRAIHLSTA